MPMAHRLSTLASHRFARVADHRNAICERTVFIDEGKIRGSGRGIIAYQSHAGFLDLQQMCATEHHCYTTHLPDIGCINVILAPS